MRRREFLAGSALAMGTVGRGWAEAAPDKADRIAIMTYSFDKITKLPGRPDSPARILEFLDLPQMFADRYKVHNVEVQHSHFVSTEPSYFKEFLGRLAKTKSRVTNINLELGDMNISASDPVLRAQAVDLTKRWIEHAVTLRSPRVMLNQGRLSPENKDVAIATLKLLVDYGRSKKVMVALEPRGRWKPVSVDASGAPSPPPPWILLTEVIKGAGGFSNPDVGNFGGDQANQHAGMRAMFPLNDGNCHMKMWTPPTFDMVAAIRLTRELGYKGLYSIEFETPSDPYAGVQAVYDLLIANM